MIRKPAKSSLADKIANVLSAVPVQFNPDDENLDATSAKIDDFDEENDNDEELLSTFRRQNVDFLCDTDQRYAGMKGSRKSLNSESSDDQLSNENASSSEDAAAVKHSESEAYESNSDNKINWEDSEFSENEGSLALSDQDNQEFQHVKDTNVSQLVKKGQCVRNQMNIWENLLEVRIQMQKCLLAANKLPQSNYYNIMIKGEPTFNAKVNATKHSIQNVLDKMILLQKLVIRKYPETKNIKQETTDGSDEEIPSDTDEEIERPPEREEEDEDLEAKKVKKRKLNDYEEELSEMHGKYRAYRNETIEKWNSKTRFSVSKNSGQMHSVVNQIDHLLGDKEKLRKRTQLKRTHYKIIGEDENNEAGLESNEENGDTVKNVEEYNSEIFDDNDFYHQLLRELIEVKSADVTDPVQLGRQWIQLQNLRSKMKRKIDTRATKGRKIRYAVHTKLVNFMAPLGRELWTEEAKNELYSSLFGKIQPKS